VERFGGVASHAELSQQCSACHAAPWQSKTMAVRCLECHRDVRETLGDTATLHGTFADAKACVRCHTEHRGSTALLTKVEGFGTAHGQFGFSLTAHQQTADGKSFRCNDCHLASSFKFEASRCVSCHRDYQAQFLGTHIEEWGRDCQGCHDGNDRFSHGVFAHDSTGFTLDGAHLRTSCASCHRETKVLADFGKTPDSCIGYHKGDDEHRGELGDDCGACHSTTSWEGAGISHEVFPLDHGDGGRIPCKTCHEDRNNYKSYTCYNCHEHSPARVEAQHRGEVRAQNLDNCLRCHRGGRGEGGEGGEHERRGRGRGERDEHD
jgi:hypothetical protein